MRKVLVFLCLFLLSYPLTAQAEYPLYDLQGHVNFTIRNAGIPVKGTISNLRGNLRWNHKRPQISLIRITADPSSIKTGIGIRDKHLQRADYFDVTNFPEIQMELLAIKKASKDTYSATFNLNIKDITREIEVPLKITRENQEEYLETDFELNRLDYRLGDKSIILSDTVNITARVLLE
ncbi:YceI family protein [Zeaxanthinibacter sp. PT1]|uniref:YceI family protein n=1 Tax=Zeaxanthinibacter TaxID=561554 RepID=UPI00234A66EC|nr:YceI family protein [Zeaxanthinibacter sp. PT1]MDC6352710.1 YceI family protein [Zeaxanthinibacter sp. PT1]